MQPTTREAAIDVDNDANRKKRAPRNRTITLTDSDRQRLRSRLITEGPSTLPVNRTVHGNSLELCPKIADASVDLLFLDPPYNLDKSFNGRRFSRQSVDDYTVWLEQILAAFRPKLRATSSIYICGDWLTSASIFVAASKYFVVRNRVTWEREKGRGALSNWKNSSEDVWFCTMGNDYTFNLDAVKIRRRVIAPYTSTDGSPKDWERSSNGNFRDTCLTDSGQFHRLDDIVFTLENKDQLLVDIKTKLLNLQSSPKGFNIDKYLEFLSKGRTSMSFFFIGLDVGASVVKCSLVSTLDQEVIQATRIQHHWAGRNSRGVTQLARLSVFDYDFSEKVEPDQAMHFLTTLINL